MIRFGIAVKRGVILLQWTTTTTTRLPPCRRWLSADRRRRIEKASKLRALRKSTNHQKAEDVADYRYRKGSKELSSASVVALWEEEPKLRNKKEGTKPDSKTTGKKKKNFVSFFDGVDAIMEEKRKERERKANLSTIFKSVGDPSTRGRDKTSGPTIATGEEPTLDRKADSQTSRLYLHNRSIFDVFPVPEAPPPRSPHAYDEEAYQQYRLLVDEIVSCDRFRRLHTKRPLTEEHLEPIIQWLRLEEKLLEYSYPTLKSAAQEGFPSQSATSRKDLSVAFRRELQEQASTFCAHTKMDEKQCATALLALKQIGSTCARRARSLPLEVAWEKLKEAGMILDQSSLNTYIYASTMYGGSSAKRRNVSLSGGSVLDLFKNEGPSEKDPSVEDKEQQKEVLVDVTEEMATFHDLLYDPTEQSLSVRVKAFVAKGDAKGAEALLDAFSSDHEDLRRRTYLPILRCYLEKGDVCSGLAVFKRMRDTTSVLLEAETYVQLIATLAERGYFSCDSPPIEGAESLGYLQKGPGLLDQLLNDMAEDVLDITSASARRLYSAFYSAFRETGMARNMVELHPLAPLASMNDPADNDELVASRVTIDAKTGLCPRTGAQLRLIGLGADERQKLRDSLIALSSSQFEKFTELKGDDNYAADELKKFGTFLDERAGPPFTAIIDGANVAFFMQNFSQGKFNYHQLEFMVNALEKMGETPLVIFPEKYGRQSFIIHRDSGNKRQKLNRKELLILDRLAKEGKLFRVKPGCLDDYYWIFASISDQTVSRAGRDLSVSPQDESSRFPGTRPILISNDQMRDHKLEMLEPRLFRRWYSCFIVNYSFTAFVDDECVDREISFSPADFFSREIQGNSSKKLNGADGGTAWHLPVRDWEPNERFCIRLPPA